MPLSFMFDIEAATRWR